MTKRKFTISVITLFIAVNTATAKCPAISEDSRFDAYKQRFVSALWELYPAWASSVGYHKYDAVLLIPDLKSRQKELTFAKSHLDSLVHYHMADLSGANKIDHQLIENQLQYIIWRINEERAFEWDPSSYNVSGSFADMLSNDYAPLEERLRNFKTRLADVPAYYVVARKNIKNPTSEHTQLAIEQNLGGISVFEKDLKDAMQKSKLSKAEKEALQKDATAAVKAIRDYAEWLKKMPNPSPRSFRLGKELYARKFALELQSRYSADDIYNKAESHKQELHGKMYELTKQLWPKYFGSKDIPNSHLMAIKMMIGELSMNHAKQDQFQQSIEQQLPQLIEFVKKKDLLYIDPSKPLVVRKEPAYMAGVAGASINSPGPYDKNGNTYYNVGSMEGWDAEKAESSLREYNHFMMPILNIHEAIPGHYTQLVYSNQSPSIIKSILGNNAMIEGWAVYTERMMLENGYDVDKGATSTEASPEMWLMYYKWNLRSTCNTILDYSVHTKNMSKQEAMRLLMDEAFQEPAEAEGKWKRVSVTQVQLCCYFTGYTEIYDLRERIKQIQKDDFSLKKFHEQFLSYGSAPVKYISQLMIQR